MTSLLMSSWIWPSLISAQIKYYGAFAPSTRRLDHCLICTQVIVYDLIDEDMNGTLAKEELVKACGEDEDVIEFVVKCPLQCINQHVAARLHAVDATSARRRAPGDLSPLDSVSTVVTRLTG